MGNEMGNNNVIGQQVPEESAKDFDKTMANADYSHELNNINDTEKDGTKDVDMSEVLKVPLISSGGDKQMASDQTKLSAANEDLDEKNRGSPQDHTSTEDDDGNKNLPTEQDKEKDGTKDVDMSEVLKAPAIFNGGDDQMASDQRKISAANEDLDEKNRGALEDHTSTQDDDGNSNLPTEQGDEAQEDSGTETATNSAETVARFDTTTEAITSNKDTSSSDEQFTQLEHETTEKSEENTTANPAMLLEENIEDLPEDKEESCSQEVAVVGDNLVGEHTVENLEGQTGPSTVEGDNLVGETTTSTESIISGYVDDETKEVVVEDEPRKRENSSYVRPEGDTNQETFKNEDLDEKNRDSLQDHTSTQDDDGNSNLLTEQGDESQDSGTETTTDGTEKVAPVGTTTEDMTSNNDTSSSDEQFKEVVHEITETSKESTIQNPLTLLEGIIGSAPQDGEESCSQEVAVVDDNLVGEDTVESLEERQAGVSVVEDLSTPSSVQGETTSSTESIITDHLDDETKEVVLEDEPRERGHSSHVRPEDDTNQETSKNEEKQEICEMGNNNTCKTTTVDTVVKSEEVLEEDEKIQGLENQEEEFAKCSAYDAPDIVEAVSQFQSALADPSATNGKEFQKHELSIAEQMSDSVSAAVEHSVIETAEKEQGGIVDKDDADKNEAANFQGDKNSDGIHDSVGLVMVHGEDFTGLGPPLSGPLSILNEEKVHEEVVIEELAAPMTAKSFALKPVEDFVKEDIKPDSSDSNEGTTTSTYEAKTIDTQETMNISQCDQPQQVLLEEPEVVKFENSETLSTCIKLVEYSSATELIFPDVFNKEREGTSDKATCCTSESNQEKVTGTVGFAAESKQKKVIANADNSSEEQCLLQKPTLGTDVGEEIPLLLSTESINSLSYSSEQHSKLVKDIPMTNITLMQAKDEAVEESEKSPLLSPREPSEGAFRAPNHSGRNNKPLRSLMTEDGVGTWSLLKEQEPVRKNNTTVSSPRSKEKQKPKSSLFAICMCCTTATN
ncbi:unnamed protein product [Triticum turgidum subsp. durum]|uniref:Uncharacterized protein n=1 Tax=Triticum turgidum subsp. durum TaxID=4567 RepID=A0A9R0RPU4_TRITD|nr:unnamed protein product [Triticum turgidum subsp. durum]